jgi:hypothetical protein
MSTRGLAVGCVLAGLLVGCGCWAQQGGVQTAKTEWCEITVPAGVKVGEEVEIRVKLTGVEGKAFLCCDLKDQDHGMVRWGGPPRELETGGETTYRLLVGDVPNLGSVYGYLYATRNQDDDWQKAFATASTPLVPIVGRSPLVDLTYKKSWIYIDASNGGKPLVSGDKWEVPVEFYLDPADHYQKTTLTIWGTGPFIDVPDGKYTTERGHIGYPGLGGRVDLTEPGAGRHVFTFTVPKELPLVRENNSVLLLAWFSDSAGEKWPWDVRANNSFARKQGFFEIESDMPGNLFTYAEPVRLFLRLKNVQQPGEKKTLRYTVHDTTGAVAAEGQQEFTVEQDGQRIAVDLDLKTRGVFLAEIDVPGWETRTTTLGRIPDLQAVTGGRPTQFGLTTHWDAPPEEVWAIAQRLGLSTCRRFTRWYRLEPGPGVYKLDDLARELDTSAKYGVREWLCVVDAPAFAFAGKPEAVSYRAFDFDRAAWEEFVRTVTTRLKGKLLGWEWLNEITPGGCEDPVGTYLDMCRIGARTAKSIDPSVTSILAGGLYPRDFRTAVLTAGAGEYIDALPVHYQNGDGITEARRDLDAAGCAKVAVWEDESARGVNAWGVPPLEELQNTEQSKWVLRQWTDELAAGCERIIYFGGAGDATGGWGYLMDDLGPRPVAATLAVLASKLTDAKPLGVFLLGDGGLFHLFERGKKALLVGSTYNEAGERVGLHVGRGPLTLTDYQGNEASIAAAGGEAELDLATLPRFIEGADLDALKAYVVPEIQVARVGSGTSANVGAAQRMTPRVTLLVGGEGRVPVRLRNLYDRPLAAKVRFEAPGGWPEQPAVSVALGRGKEEVRQIAVRVPDTAETKDYTAKLVFDLGGKLPPVEKPLVLSVISPDMLGNLMPNGDFETPDAAGTGPEGFTVNGQTKRWADAETTPGLGVGRHVLRFENCAEWDHCGRTIPARGGQTYLYTAWACDQDMDCGSNMTQTLTDGSEVRLYDTQVFVCGATPYWQVFTCRKEMPAGTERVAFTPVAKGSGWAAYDNIRVTIYEGSDYAAEAHRAPRPPKIDGKLDDWVTRCPIPLIGANQITAKAQGYAWTPANLSGVGYLMWDEANLYMAFEVRDEVHHATGSGQQTAEAFLAGDSLLLGLDPTRRGPDAEAQAFAYCLASTVPGGGSGKHTLLRPTEHSGGRPAGHLFRDSSVYDMAMAESDGGCVYELRIPLTEVGVAGALGTKLGFSVQLNDSDGAPHAAQMNWGGGLFPRWDPREFGIVTFVD